MAKAVEPATWENGFKAPSTGTPWVWPPLGQAVADDDTDAYVSIPSQELVTSAAHNDLGVNLQRTWPTMYDGTNSPHGTPDWWVPKTEVDVLIVGAGPSGLQVALSLARQNVSFRIIDKAEAPLTVGRADGVQPRFLETAALWGLAEEIHEEGPLIERTAIYKDGKKLLFNRSHQSDSRYRGLHIITQGQLERIYIRDLLRHRALVERSRLLEDFRVDADGGEYPVHTRIRDQKTGAAEEVRAKFIVGSDGAASMLRKRLEIPFDGVSTGIYWGIMDCVFETDYPHAWMFGSVISSQHGGCVIIPREDGYIRLYTQLDTSATGPLAASRQAADPSFAEAGGHVDVHSITPDEVLEQANRIFAPYKLKFGSPLSWFAIWKISERVARSFSSPDMRVHLAGDAAHVHSVMGAFGLNTSIMDSANLAWKLGLVAQNKAQLEALLPTYNGERREFAVRVIETSGRYLRFVCGSELAVPNLRDMAALERGDAAAAAGPHGGTNGIVVSKASTPEEDLRFLGDFFKANGQFLLGVDAPYAPSVVVAARTADADADAAAYPGGLRPVGVKAGVRAPNPRLCFGTAKTGYLYDRLAGPPRFHVVLFLSSLAGRAVRAQAGRFARAFLGPGGAYARYGGARRFHVVIVLKRLPFEVAALRSQTDADGLAPLWDRVDSGEGEVLYDDRAPDEDAHYTYAVNHSTGGLVVIRPDLWVGLTSSPGETDKLDAYFDGFLLPDRE